MMAALNREPTSGRPPHFELEFFLTMEAFGRVHPSQRDYRQWQQMSETERDLHRRDVADLHLETARRYEQAGMLFHSPRGWNETDTRQALEYVRKLGGQERWIALHGDATYAIPHGDAMMAFVARLADDPEGVKDEARRRVDKALERGKRLRRWGTLDGFCLCADYCFNDNPFLSPAMFDVFVAPYLKDLVTGYREMGYYVVKHTDGNIMPILDVLVSANPHALHSLDPQGGVDLAEVKHRVGDRVCLIGNVNCALLQTGTDQEAAADVQRALVQGAPGGGYIFSTSNCIYTGMSLKRYEMMLDIWRQFSVETACRPKAEMNPQPDNTGLDTTSGETIV